MNATFLSFCCSAIRTSCCQGPEPARDSARVSERANGGGSELVLERLRAARALDAVALAVHVPADRRLDRVLVRRRGEAELALGLRVAVGPPLRRQPHL